MKNSWRIFPGLPFNDNVKDVIDYATTGATSIKNDDKFIFNERIEHIADDNATCTKAKSILESLTDDEIELAARAYYEYAIESQSTTTETNAETEPVRNERRNRYATAVAKQYIRWFKDESIETIVRNLKDNIRFRTKHQIDQLRLVHTNSTSEDYDKLRANVGQKMVYVSGYDLAGRSTYYFIPRNTQNHDFALQVHLWTMERAIACSKHADRTINAIVDFAEFDTKQNSPPLSIGKDLLRTLSYHYYSNHINSIFLVNAPVPFIYMWSMVFKHFINKRTASKIHFIKSPSKSKLKSSAATSSQKDIHDRGNTPLHHSFASNTETEIIYEMQPKQQLQSNKQACRPLFSSVPFLSNVIHTAASTSSATGLLRAGGDGSDNSKVSTQHKWISRIFAVRNNRGTQPKKRRDKRTKSTSLDSTMNFNVDESESYFSSTGNCTDTGTTVETCNTAPSDSSTNIQSDSILHQLYSSDQIPSWIIPKGTKNRELDVGEYLDGIPFNHAFDE